MTNSLRQLEILPASWNRREASRFNPGSEIAITPSWALTKGRNREDIMQTVIYESLFIISGSNNKNIRCIQNLQHRGRIIVIFSQPFLCGTRNWRISWGNPWYLAFWMFRLRFSNCLVTWIRRLTFIAGVFTFPSNRNLTNDPFPELRLFNIFFSPVLTTTSANSLLSEIFCRICRMDSSPVRLEKFRIVSKAR